MDKLIYFIYNIHGDIMNDLVELIQNLNFEDNRYFYHITSRGRGKETFESGLFMEDKNLCSTTIEVPEEMICDPVGYCEQENRGRLSGREEMILIQCEKGEEDNLVIKSDESLWNNDSKMEYLIPPENILCYIDLETLIVTYNYEYQYFNGRGM